MRVLLVDDDGDSRTIFRTMFERFGHEVLEAEDGEDALRLAGEHPLDVILLDMELPGKNGWEITRILQSDARTARMPVIALSAHALAQHEAQAREAGCVGYLTKPIGPTHVLQAVERILRSRGSEP